MLSLTKIVHVLAVGLWFGATVFFTFVVGLSLFDTFENATAVPADKRPYWLTTPEELKKDLSDDHFPKPLSKEQGGRIFGLAVGSIFRPYFILQVACGLLAGLSALAWYARGGAHKVRPVILLLALAGASAGWWLEREVEALRVERSTASDAVLTNPSPSAEQVHTADEARAKFGTWHAYSLFVNFGTLALVTTAMVLTAFLPAARPEK